MRIIRFFSLAILMITLAGCRVAPEVQTRQPISDRVRAEPRNVSLNLRDLPQPTANPPYRFLVVGHLYGTIQGDDRDPAQTLLSKLPELNRMGLRFLVSLGDLVKHSEAEDFDRLDQKLLEPASFPVFNTVGNHDVENRALYEQRYGATYYSFHDGPSWMIFLDTERESCAIDAPQEEMLSGALDAALQDNEVRQVFIFMHKTLFFHNERLFEIHSELGGPNVWDCYGQGNFAGLMERVIQPAARRKPVYLFAGDVGAYGNLSPYYERHADIPLTLVMTGIGDFPSDSAILVTVEQGEVRLEAYSLTGQALPPLESYTPDQWAQRVDPQ